MQSKATTVTEYLKTVPADRLDALIELRDLCLRTLKGFKESMQYGMPSYSLHNEVQVAWNSQKDHLSLYILTDRILDSFKNELKKTDWGKSCIRYKKPTDLDFTLIEKILQQVVLSAK